MIVAVAVCPAAPWLVPGVAPRLAERAGTVAMACRAAVAGLADVDQVVAVVPSRHRRTDVAAGDRVGGPPGRAAGRLTVMRSDRGSGPVQDIGPAVAHHLLARAGVTVPVEIVEIDPSAGLDVPGPASLCDPQIRVGLLVLADGAAAHGPSAPGRADARSEELDAVLGRALADGNPDALAAATAPGADPDPVGLLARVATLRALAAWTAAHPPERSALLVNQAPFGVGYLVARWGWKAASRGQAGGIAPGSVGGAAAADRAPGLRHRATVSPADQRSPVPSGAVPSGAGAAARIGGRLIVISGPTATGKSDLALDVAERLADRGGAEIVNADSMQLYRGMDIGTAKTPPAQRRDIPHHQFDVLDVTETASVATYQEATRAIVADILARGRTPLLVGGSGLYIQSVVDDIAFPPTDPTVRARLEDEAETVGSPALFARLAAADPEAAAVIDPRNPRRIVRALEVIELTGRPFSATLPRPGQPRFDARMVRVDRPTADLDDRIERRVRLMVAEGLLDEVRELVGRGLRDGFTARRALGYPQMLAVLDGTADLESAIVATAAATRRFVRRQRSWFARDHRLIDIDPTADDAVDEVLRLVDEP